MSESGREVENQLERILLAQEKIMSAVVRHERRLERLHQEFAKAVTVIYRLKLAADHAKAGAQRQEVSLEEMSRRLSGIEQAIAAMGK